MGRCVGGCVRITVVAVVTERTVAEQSGLRCIAFRPDKLGTELGYPEHQRHRIAETGVLVRR